MSCSITKPYLSIEDQKMSDVNRYNIRSVMGIPVADYVLASNYDKLEATNDKLDGLNASLDLENKALKAERDDLQTMLDDSNTALMAVTIERDRMREQIEDFNNRMDGFLKAYPESMFPEPTKEEYKQAHELLDGIKKGFGSALHGSWGRHIAKTIKQALKDQEGESPHENPSCFGKKLDVEACNHGCPVSDECYRS